MQQEPQQPVNESGRPHAHAAEYPHGRGYGHDYMRGGEVFGGYGYSERDEYARRRGETDAASRDATDRRHGADATEVS